MRKLLFITSEFPPLPGGIGHHAFHLSSQLQKQGMTVTVVTNQRSRELKSELDFDTKLPFRIKRIQRHSISVITYLLRVQAVLKILLTDTPSTVISSGKFSLWLGAVCKKLFPNIHCIAVLHGSEIFAGGNISQKLTRWSLLQFDSLVAVSNFTRDLALKQNSSLAIQVINNGFSPRPAADKVKGIDRQPVLVTVGNVTFRKGQQHVIASLPLLQTKFPAIHYHIVGIPTEQKKFAALAASLGVSDLVTFHGALSDADLKDIVSGSDVFFMLSDHLKNGDVEGFGIAVIEANSMGLPAIGSRNSGIADAIKDGYSGKLVSPHEEEGILSALEAIMNDYDNYSDRAQVWAAQFDWSIVVKKYLEILNR